jgi:hypothetical protein
VTHFSELEMCRYRHSPKKAFVLKEVKNWTNFGGKNDEDTLAFLTRRKSMRDISL